MLTLGLIARNEEDMLRRTLPVVAPFFKHRVLLDTGSIDGTKLLSAKHGLGIVCIDWANDFAAARNLLLDLVTKDEPGDAWMLQLDADEAMFPCDLIALERLCATVTQDVIALPRFNLADRGTLHCTDNAPDWQARCVRLGSDVRWTQPVHEVIKAPHHRADGIPIYHYGWCKPPRECWLRSHNYERILAGEPTLTEAPAWVCNDPTLWLFDMQKRHTFVPFNEMHPLRGLI